MEKRACGAHMNKSAIETAFNGIREAVYERMFEMNQEDGLKLLALWDGVVSTVSLMTAFSRQIEDDEKRERILQKLTKAAVTSISQMKDFGVKLDPDHLSSAISGKE